MCTEKCHSHTLLIILLTFRRKSWLLRYGDLNEFLAFFPAVKLLTFRQSKKWSNFSAMIAVSPASSPPYSCNALATELLNTYVRATHAYFNYTVVQILHPTIDHKHSIYLSSQVHSHFREVSQVEMLKLQFGNESQPTVWPVALIQLHQVTPRNVLSSALYNFSIIIKLQTILDLPTVFSCC